jgi:hypothetical protein
MTRAPSGDHELPSSTRPDRDVVRLPRRIPAGEGNLRPLALAGTSPLMSVPGWNVSMLDCLPTHP